MLFGPFPESTKSKVFLEEDPKAFSILLHICHHKYADLPSTLSHRELHDLAIPCDKYDLSAVVAPMVKWNRWLDSHKKDGAWSTSTDPQEWLFITYIFELESDYDFFVHYFAMCANSDEDGVYESR